MNTWSEPASSARPLVTHLHGGPTRCGAATAIGDVAAITRNATAARR